MLYRLCVAGMMVALLNCGDYGAVMAQQPSSAAGTLTPEQATQTWAAAEQQIERIEKRLTEIQATFPMAQGADQNKLRTEALALVEQIKQQFRSLGQAVPQVYQARVAAGGDGAAKSKELAQQAMALAYSENRYGEAEVIAGAILKVEPKDPVALNIAGVSQFATNHFEESVATLEQGQEANLLMPDLGGHYLDSARNYVKYWETEQAIRAKEAQAMGDAANPRVLLKTTRGNVEVELFEDNAPNTVANFISLVEKGFYDGSAFHRVIPNFMAQGGMPGKKFGGTTGPGYTIECECYRPDARRHFAGTLSMAHAGKDTGGSQFFITHLPTPHLDRELHPESVHTVFGRVIEGMNVVAGIQQGDVIESATVTRKRPHPYVPQTQPDRR